MAPAPRAHAGSTQVYAMGGELGPGAVLFGDRAGVETEAFARLARRAVETHFVRDVLESLSGRAMIIGVDRLDYSKGIPERMSVFEIPHDFPDWRGKVTYLQITPRSRTGIPEYADMGRSVGEPSFMAPSAKPHGRRSGTSTRPIAVQRSPGFIALPVRGW